jgi:hypothetical protein
MGVADTCSSIGVIDLEVPRAVPGLVERFPRPTMARDHFKTGLILNHVTQPKMFGFTVSYYQKDASTWMHVASLAFAHICPLIFIFHFQRRTSFEQLCFG